MAEAAATDRRALLAAGALLGAAALGQAWRLRPPPPPPAALDLEALVPQRIGDWRWDSGLKPVVPDTVEEDAVARAYDRTLARAYIRADAPPMMLVVASGAQRTGRLAVHRPSVCYTAQGFTVGTERDMPLPPPMDGVVAQRLFAAREGRDEPIVYWMTIDGERSGFGFAQKLRLLASELEGNRAEGFLVRASTLAPDAPESYAAVAAFLTALLTTLPADARRLLAGV